MRRQSTAFHQLIGSRRWTLIAQYANRFSTLETEILSKAAEVGELSIPSTTRLSHSTWFNFFLLITMLMFTFINFLRLFRFARVNLKRKNSPWTNRFIYIMTPIPHSIYREHAITFVFNFRVFSLRMAMEFMAPAKSSIKWSTARFDSPNQSLRNFNFLSIRNIHQSLFKESRHAVCDTQQGETKRVWTLERFFFLLPTSS